MATRHRFFLLVLTSALLGLLARWGGAFLPDDPLEFDDATVFLVSFDLGTDGIDREGPNGVKNTLLLTPDGVFGSQAVEIPPRGAVGMYRTPRDLDANFGSLEMWVKAPDIIQGRNTLFSLDGRQGLLGDNGSLELVVGEEDDGSGRPTRANIYTAGDSGRMDLTHPTASFPSTTMRGVVSGDVDGDGRPDLVASMYQANEVQVFLGPLNNHQRMKPDRRYTVPSPQGLSLIDFDDDGDLDFIVASFDALTPPFYGFENDGTGNYIALDWGFQDYPPAPGGEGTAVGDVNGDGILDVLVGVLSYVAAAVWYGSIDGDGRYQIAPLDLSLFAPNTLGADLADLNQDGWLDVVLSRPGGITFLPQDGDILVYYNQGQGQFPTKPDVIIPSYGAFTCCATRDLNHDGHLDIVSASLDTTHSRVHFGPNFVSLQKFKVDDAVSLTVADLNGDGVEDVFFRSQTGNSPLYTLDVDGAVVRRRVLRARGTMVGMGSHAATGGTSPYGTTLQRANSFELFLDEGRVVFELTDDRNVVHSVNAPYPEALSGTQRDYQYVRAEWDAAAGLVRLSVGDPSLAPNPHILNSNPFNMGSHSSVFRIGTSTANQRAATGWKIDDVRISDNLRGDNVCQKDFGFDGPGELRLEVCGQYLRPGNSATLRLATNLPDQLVYLIVANHFTPVYVSSVDAHLMSTPWLTRLLVKTDANGDFFANINGGLLDGVPQDLYIQSFCPDPTTTKGAAVSNILQVRFQAP